MKKITLLLVVFVLGCSVVFAQSIESKNCNKPITKKINNKSSILLNSKASMTDTVYFNLARLSSSDSAKLLGLYSTSATSMGQYFERPQAMQVLGTTFFAVCSAVASVNVTVAIYNCAADSTPTGTALSTVIVPVDSSWANGIEIFAAFSPAVSVTGPYVITVSNTTAKVMFYDIVENDYF